MQTESRIEQCDFVVIGSGVAGLRAALELAGHGSVLVVTKDRPSESCSEYAQGGVAVALSDEDEVSIHYDDTIRAGDGLCRPEAVHALVEEGPRRIQELMAWGARFDRDGSALLFAREAAHSRRRILRAQGDSTGREIVRTLLEKARSHSSIAHCPHCHTVDFIIRDDRCVGVLLVRDDELIACHAGAVVLATGGAGRLYSRTTNPEVATGDGIAMAFRAGAVVEDMEFVQFHPTSLFVPGAPQFLLSEAMRGEGGRLRNSHGRPFMARYHPDEELAPRDIVSRAILSEMVATKANHVYLDMTHLAPAFVEKRFPRITQTCRQFGVDPTKTPVPVSPAAHYLMGGVRTALDGATSIPGLFAAGEVACTGVHGANRLASNSLLEGLVFGARAARAAAAFRAAGSRVRPSAPVYDAAPEVPPDARALREALRRLMWEKVGIIRCAESLGLARKNLSGWARWTETSFLSRPGLELRNMLTTASLILHAAQQRTNSVGAHYRSDCAAKSSGWDQHYAFTRRDPALLSETAVGR